VTRAQRASLLHGIYVIVNDSPRSLEIAQAALDEGVRVLQYRAKGGIAEGRVRALVDAARRYDALVILNDDWRAAKAHGCDGVHLGPGDEGFSDLAPVRAAFPLGIVGVSCASEGEMRAAHRGGADYAGVGSVFATSSKQDAGMPIGIAGLQRIAAAAPLAAAAIGGVTIDSIGEIKCTGVAMAAVISAVANAADPRAAARELVRAWEK